MKYMLLIYEDESRPWKPGEQESVMGEYFAFTNGLRESGAFVAGEALQPTTTATTVRVRDGETLVTDGPFAETKELLAGYYIVEADSPDDALEHAAGIPAARTGSIEVRPIMVYERVEA